MGHTREYCPQAPLGSAWTYYPYAVSPEVKTVGPEVYQRALFPQMRPFVKGGLKVSHRGGEKGDHFGWESFSRSLRVLGAAGAQPCEAGRPSV
jgi:hypothetical protein